MSAGEERATGRKTIQMRRLHLWMSAQATEPVVLIVHGDKQDVRRSRHGRRGLRGVHGHCRRSDGGQSDPHELSCDAHA